MGRPMKWTSYSTDQVMGFKEIRRNSSVVNIFCFLVAVVASAVFKLKVIPPVKRGFFCDDTSIRYPLRPETINNLTLCVSCIGPAVLLIFALELSYGCIRSRYSEREVVGHRRGWNGLKNGLGKSLLVIACWMYGNSLNMFITEVFKLSFGGLRPNFLSGCQPETDVTSLPNCTRHYVEHIQCTNPDAALVEELRKSFVSGHATLASFNMVFIMLYLQHRLPVSTPRLARYLFQTMALAWIIFIVASRVQDNYHHPADIVWGCIQGAAFACLTMYKICPRFATHPPKSSQDLLPTTVMTKHPVTATTSAGCVQSHTCERVTK